MMVKDMTFNQYYLCHHGIKGQKHGVRNGPPYPLDYSKLSPEERKNAKREAIKTGNVKEANQNVYYFDNKEIQMVLDRYFKKQDIKKIAEKDIKTGRQKVEDIISAAQLFVKATNTGIQVYNNVAKITNAMNKATVGNNAKQLPIIGGGDGKKKKKDKK